MIRGGSWGGRRSSVGTEVTSKGAEAGAEGSGLPSFSGRRASSGYEEARPRPDGLPIIERVDSAGRYLLALMRRYGAQLRATGAEMTELVRTLAGDWPLTEE
jgi:hypothetical protein